MFSNHKNRELANSVIDLLVSKKAKLSVAESCTGGLIADQIVSIAGASACFELSIVTYSNEAKEKVLGVSSKTLLEFGAVSEETAREMAHRVRIIANADIGISVTGIAGPSGGSASKPVGTVCFGLSTNDTLTSIKLHAPMERNEFRQFCANKALETVYCYLTKA